MRECFEEGILQGYLDNELSPELAARVAGHVAVCDQCAETLSAASEETLVLTKAFEAEMMLEVPTVSLRERIDAAISASTRLDVTVSRKSWLAALAGRLSVSPQRALGFASLIVLVAFAAIFAVLRRGSAPTQVARSVAISGGKGVPSAPTPTPSNPKGPSDQGSPDRKQKKKSNPVIVPEPDQLPKDELVRALPGEVNYLKAIDSLAVEIKASGETALRPSLRAEYERNLAVVDQAIDSTRRVARRNPRDPDAAAFLYSSYQSKLDLLSAVAEQVRPTIATR